MFGRHNGLYLATDPRSKNVVASVTCYARPRQGCMLHRDISHLVNGLNGIRGLHGHVVGSEPGSIRAINRARESYHYLRDPGIVGTSVVTLLRFLSA